MTSDDGDNGWTARSTRRRSGRDQPTGPTQRSGGWSPARSAGQANRAGGTGTTAITSVASKSAHRR